MDTLSIDAEKCTACRACERAYSFPTRECSGHPEVVPPPVELPVGSSTLKKALTLACVSPPRNLRYRRLAL